MTTAFDDPRTPWRLASAALFVVTAWTAVAADDCALPGAASALFMGSGACAFCHDGGGRALATSSGEDLSIGAAWRSTMMAASARDPVWQAKVETEAREHPELRKRIENRCTTCHAPMGRVEARRRGEDYSLAEARRDPLALDGVSCTVCHQIQSWKLGEEESFSGGFEIDASRHIFGPYRDVFPGPMLNHVGYRPVFGQHAGSSSLCATCHTLYTPYVGDDGRIAGTFPEQVPWLEWRNSSYPGRGTECQTCHMPSVEEPVRITSHPPWIGTQSPFHKHHFVGANTFMLGTLTGSAAELDVTATRAQLEMTLARTRAQLRERSAGLEVRSSVQGGTLTARVEVENLAGHKLPTGFPARRLWLRVRVTDSAGGTVFESGGLDGRGRIAGVGDGWQPHHDIIRSEGHVQVYEAILKDTSGRPTFGLLRAAGHLKDNRLPPKGFTTGGGRDRDVEIIGVPASDVDFNRDGHNEGTGRDVVTYQIDVSRSHGTLEIETTLLYRSFQAGFLKDLLSQDTPAVGRLERLLRRDNTTAETVQSRRVAVRLPD